MGLRMEDLHAPTVASGPTSRSTANGTDERLSLQELVKKKENLEAELSALGSVLDSHGVNMNTSLTTFDGFPRADLDVAQIRTTRARIIRLKNDYKALMAKLEDVVHQHFAEGKVPEGDLNALTDRGTRERTTMNELPHVSNASSTSTSSNPFARVNSVERGSPADQAGLKVGDQVVRFGLVDYTNHERLNKVAQVVQQNENCAILVIVLRKNIATDALEQHHLRLTPRRNWGGRGLLGCHLLPV
ncbi:hypothetical protein M433DRAFT_65088 [Acidomyces richmondensis BFW]|nr:MAG: hypothetical protein FE78DRAFT_140092 [Acidomyces sp. 'richmondensis']KYG46475.1 hypothetical protein M433DRAFT_65088 [Acidomyces richmondensis BFW]